MRDESTTVQNLKEMVGRFAAARDWEQYHSPKNLAMSLAIEAAELMELFQWCTLEESRILLHNRAARKRIEEELADVASYLFEFCHLYQMDLASILAAKMKKNHTKYPVALAKGRSEKYTSVVFSRRGKEAKT